MDNFELQKRANTYKLAILSSKVSGILSNPENLDENAFNILEMAIEFLDSIDSGFNYITDTRGSFRPEAIQDFATYAFFVEQLDKLSQDVGGLSKFFALIKPGKNALLSIKKGNYNTQAIEYQNARHLFKTLSQIFENQILWMHSEYPRMEKHSINS